MALLQTQIDLINALVDATTITPAQGLELVSSSNGFSSAQIAFIQGLGLSASDQELLLTEARSTQDTIETEINQAKEYLKAGQYLECRKWIVLAEMTMASMPDYQLANRRIEYREGIRYIKNSLAEIEARAGASSVNRRVSARYIRE